MSLRLKKVGEKGSSSTRPDLSMPAENVSHAALERALDRATPTDENYALKGKCKGPETRIREEIQPSIPVSMILAQQAGPSSCRRERTRDNRDNDEA